MPQKRGMKSGDRWRRRLVSFGRGFLVIACALGPALAFAQAQPQQQASDAPRGEPARSAEDQKDAAERAAFDARRQDMTLGGHVFVAPLALRSVPFEFAIPVAQLASYTQVEYAHVSGERNAGAPPGVTHYMLAAQTYHLSVRIGRRVEISAALLGEVASGTDGSSIVSGGASAAGGGNLGFAYRLLPFEKLAVTVRAGGHLEVGIRANIEPLVYQAVTNTVSITSGGLDAARVGYPSREFSAWLGLSAALALSPAVSTQAFVRLDAVSTKVSPFIERQGMGTEASAKRELVYEAWNPSFGATLGLNVSDDVLIQPQFGFSHHSDELVSPRQDKGPYARGWYFVPAVQATFHASPVLQLGGGVGAEIATLDLADSYKNEFTTHTWSLFAQLVARYIWGQEWPGH